MEAMSTRRTADIALAVRLLPYTPALSPVKAPDTYSSDGTKRTLTTVLAQIAEQGDDPHAMMDRVRTLVLETVVALQSEIILRRNQKKRRAVAAA